MELKRFIKETIIQISEGINEIITRNDELRILVNPNITVGSGVENFYLPTDPENIAKMERRVQMLHYDIALTISEEDNIEIGGKVSVSFLGAQGNESGNSKKQSESRLHFSIPICLPVSEVRKS